MGPTACCLQPLRDPQHFLLIHYNSHLRWKTGGGTTRGGGGCHGYSSQQGEEEAQTQWQQDPPWQGPEHSARCSVA